MDKNAEPKMDCFSSRVISTGSLFAFSMWAIQERIRQSKIIYGKRQFYCALYVAASGAAFYRCFFVKVMVPESERFWIKRAFI